MGALPFFEHGLDPFSRIAGDSCVLALADATPHGSNAVSRAAQLAHGLGLPLRVLDAAGGDARRALADIAPPPALLVMPHLRGNPLAECVFGAAAERIFRRVFTPTLVVRQPARAAYERVLVPAKLEASAAVLVAAARCLSRNARISVLHVMGTQEEHTLRLAHAPQQALRAQRARRSTAAWEAMNRFIAAAGAGDRAVARIVFGYAPARVLEAACASRAQLVVLGKPRRGVFSEMLRDGVSQRLLSDAGADVLLVPLREDARAQGHPAPAACAARV